ncbi:MAG TPA: hypothetical protein VMV92_06760 [Streptosporangiaceae bacterium]|nr:hypothetical protein [Streptosporangiaceae bacterium]
MGAPWSEASEQYSEQKFLQVSQIIERFRGREGQSEADGKWTRFVTDVRNWYIFTGLTGRTGEFVQPGGGGVAAEVLDPLVEFAGLR